MVKSNSSPLKFNSSPLKHVCFEEDPASFWGRFVKFQGAIFLKLPGGCNEKEMSGL